METTENTTGWHFLLPWMTIKYCRLSLYPTPKHRKKWSGHETRKREGWGAFGALTLDLPSKHKFKTTYSPEGAARHLIFRSILNKINLLLIVIHVSVRVSAGHSSTALSDWVLMKYIAKHLFHVMTTTL